MWLLEQVGAALAASGTMAWQIGWSLVLGFALAAGVQAVVPRESVAGLLGDDSPASLARATGFGIASSSCSYAAVALARSLFRKGASFSAAIVFEIASTNLVIELGIILALLLGWQFTLAEFVGGPIVIVLMAFFLRVVVRRRLLEEAREQAEKGVAGSMEGHAAMDMSVEGDAPWWRKLASADGFTSLSHVFVMEWAAVLRDIVIGLLVAGAVSAWVPDSVWETLFLADHPVLAAFWGPLIGPFVAIASFVCSIGNVPLAAVLYQGGLGFGGVVAFLYADLIILPILVIYRKYYGTRMMLTLLAGFYAAMVISGLVVEGLFTVGDLVPPTDQVSAGTAEISWNYTTWLDIAFGLFAVVLVLRFVRTGGREMLSMMGGSPDDARHG